MRIAVIGAHGTGKTTLIEDLAAASDQFEIVPEPFWVFPQGEAAFLDGPTTEDLEEQLKQSCDLICDRTDQKNVVFDRCPLDFLAYLDVISNAEGYEWVPDGKLMTRIERAMQALDLVVFVPVLSPDEIEVQIEFPKLRRQVDARLKRMLRDDKWGFFEADLRVIEVSGSPTQRVSSVVTEVTARGTTF